MSAPEAIFIDERVADRLPAEPPESDAPTVHYMRADIVAALMHQASGDTEFFIQVSWMPGERGLLALTNFGRIFRKPPDSNFWEEIAGPRLDDFPR